MARYRHVELGWPSTVYRTHHLPVGGRGEIRWKCTEFMYYTGTGTRTAYEPRSHGNLKASISKLLTKPIEPQIEQLE
jgi:hypothetical protein